MQASSAALRVAGATTSVLAAGLLAAGSLLPRWWVGTEGDVRMGVGMRAVELCGGRGCADRGLEGLATGPGSWHLLGATAFAAGWVAVAFLLAAAAGALLARRSAGARWPGRLAVAAAGISLFALVLGAGFAWTYPGFAGLGAGPALFLFMIGGALGVGGAGVLLRRAAG